MNGLLRRDRISRSLNAMAEHLFSLMRLLSEHFTANLYIVNMYTIIYYTKIVTQYHISVYYYVTDMQCIFDIKIYFAAHTSV